MKYDVNNLSQIDMQMFNCEANPFKFVLFGNSDGELKEGHL